MPKDRRTSLSVAMLRISASLDLETVLREVVESARTLTGARYGAITTIDETGAPKDFVTSGPAYIPSRLCVHTHQGEKRKISSSK